MKLCSNCGDKITTDETVRMVYYKLCRLCLKQKDQDEEMEKEIVS